MLVFLINYSCCKECCNSHTSSLALTSLMLKSGVALPELPWCIWTSSVSISLHHAYERHNSKGRKEELNLCYPVADIYSSALFTQLLLISPSVFLCIKKCLSALYEVQIGDICSNVTLIWDFSSMLDLWSAVCSHLSLLALRALKTPFYLDSTCWKFVCC